MHEIIAVRRLFFKVSFEIQFRTLHGAGPIKAVNRSNDVSPLELHSLYGSMVGITKIKNVSFTSQNLKICIAAYGEFERLHKRRVLGVGQSNGVIKTCPTWTLVVMTNN